MYRDLLKNENKQNLTNKAIELLSNKNECLQSMLYVSNNWLNSTKQNFSNPSQNRRSWLGQAACCYKENIPEYLVREAWMQMSEGNRVQANKIADQVILRWELITLIKLNG